MPPTKRPRLTRLARIQFRRLVRRLDRLAPLILLWLPSWGTSLLLHAIAILLLALYFYTHTGARKEAVIQASLPSQLSDDVTSLVPAKIAGDPFTTLKNEESPSLALKPSPLDAEEIVQPKMPDLTEFAPELAAPEMPMETAPGPEPKGARARGGRGGSGRGLPYALHAESLIAPFSGRQGESKAKLVRREGGTARSEKAVEDGIDWLIRHQREDGGWSLNFHGQCRDGDGCPEQVAMESDTAATGLALLPLLGAGHIHTAKSRYQGNVRKGLEWLVERQQDTGDFFIGGSNSARMYSHAIATMAVCEAYGLSQDQTLRGPAQKAINFIIESQNSADGGWRYFPTQPGDTSVFGWQMFALRSARLSGLKIPINALKGCKTYLDLAATDASKTMYGYQPGRDVSPVMTAEALLSRQYLGWPRNFPPLVKGASQVANHLMNSQDRNIYYWYYATQLLHNMQNKDWKRWNVQVREGLIVMQIAGKGCDRGSWDPRLPQPDRWGASGGRLFLTALSLLTLEVYYRYLPLYQPSDADSAPLDADAPAEPKKPIVKPNEPAALNLKAGLAPGA
ncbi:prenyltransferase/squalene oxidase repeat-containing protein [Singulisphaera sp. PoT]|uniref:prenyltransferase/squalene oxidase repeat-containing protein n=1 Tax=Singulisphaera sp. PoT TaxID=3411797 RepID=UPI003BF5F58C